MLPFYICFLSSVLLFLVLYVPFHGCVGTLFANIYLSRYLLMYVANQCCESDHGETKYWIFICVDFFYAVDDFIVIGDAQIVTVADTKSLLCRWKMQ